MLVFDLVVELCVLLFEIRKSIIKWIKFVS